MYPVRVPYGGEHGGQGVVLVNSRMTVSVLLSKEEWCLCLYENGAFAQAEYCYCLVTLLFLWQKTVAKESQGRKGFFGFTAQVCSPVMWKSPRQDLTYCAQIGSRECGPRCMHSSILLAQSWNLAWEQPHPPQLAQAHLPRDSNFC